MLRLTRTAIGLLTAQYRSVLKKCWAINVGVFSLMGKAAASVSKGVADTIGGALSAFGVNIVDVLSMMRSLDSMLNIQRHPDVEQRGTEGSSYADGITSFLQNDWILRFVNTPLRMTGKGATLPVAVVAATVMATTLTAMPTEAEALKWCIAGYSSTPLTLVADEGSCPGDSTEFGIQSGSSSSAFGTHNIASGDLSSAFGAVNTASGYYSSAFGYGNTASGEGSTALGYHSNAAQNYTTAIGYQAVANVAGTTTQGIISVGHKNGDPKGYESGNYTSDYFSKIINVANGTDDHDAATVGQMNTALNNYYRNEDFGIEQVIDFARYFKSGKLVLKSENLGVDLTSESENLPSNLTSKIGGFATNHPLRLGAFAKCEKACSRPSERYIAALGKNRVFENIASTDAGTFLFVSQTRKNVLDSLSKCRAANDNFIKDATTFLRAI